MRKIELLSPARDAEIGKAAFDHGADAVYVGAPKFSARAAAGNEIKDIESLAAYGHRFGAKTYAAFNTLLFEREMEEAERMAWQLYEAGVDALIVQDMGLLRLNLPPIELHASTQTDNRTAEKVQMMRELGMTRVVLARELDLEQIRAIHEAVPDVELECFVHGALCVSVSGQCYLSETMMGRSANRGVCAQPCRLPMNLLNARGETVVKDKHLLSLRDMNRSGQLEKLIAAGVTSLKIEGRLKDLSYVKNITAFYRRELDAILENHPDWAHVSDGDVWLNFEPNPKKTFNRGYTSYMKDRCGYWNFETPKSIGEPIGRVLSISDRFFTVEGAPIANGDGLMVGTIGIRANRTESFGKKTNVYPLFKKELYFMKPNDNVYRNYDSTFERILSKNSAERRIGVDISFCINGQYALLEMSDGTSSALVTRGPFEAAERQLGRDFYEKNICALGTTIFYPRSFDFQVKGDRGEGESKALFIPAKKLNEMRREAVDLLLKKREERETEARRNFQCPDYAELAKDITNSDCQLFLEHPEHLPVMTTRHCLKYALGNCPKHGKPKVGLSVKPEDWIEPMTLEIGGKKFILKFGCKNLCYSEIFPIFARK